MSATDSISFDRANGRVIACCSCGWRSDNTIAVRNVAVSPFNQSNNQLDRLIEAHEHMHDMEVVS